MSQHSDEANPYRSPPAADGPAEPASRPVTWLIVPVVLLYLYGGLLVVYAVLFPFLVFVAGGSINTGDMSHRASVAQIVVMLLAVALSGVHGGFAIAVGRCLWKRCWRRAVVALAGAIVLMVMVCTAHCVVRQLPPGEPWPWHQAH